ncbi:MAG: WD40/YVTN/BNR-like repeat-containing protein, partial [Ignavibacteria bacterium]
MSNGYKSFLLLAFAAVISFFLLLEDNSEIGTKHKRIRPASSPKANLEMKKARDDYFFYLLRDPASNRIPPDIRKMELQFSEQLNEKKSSLNKSSNLAWAEAGPNNVGGRTRALAIDINDPNTVIAGGASGGIWKSTDKGATWILKSTSSTILSVSSIAQDPRPGFTNNWYYSTGEFNHNLAGTIGSSFTGDGIYKSTDNGETWNVLPSTHSSNVAQWDGDFDFVLKVAVSPVNGNIYAAANGIGIFRSTDGGTSFTKVLGNVNHHIYSDVAVASNGTVLAVLSTAFQGNTPTITPGLYRSTNNGDNWTNITPGSYPSGSFRSVVAVAPSNPNTGYLLTNTGLVANEKEVNNFYKININLGTSEDRSSNLPDFTSLGGVAAQVGYVTTQGGYDMIVAVKPDNENFVLIGGSSLFLSTDGFATKPQDNKTAWVGGYHPQSFGYPNFHPDVHSFAFDPSDPKKMWWGHDGGLSYTSDITNTSYQTYFPWENKNNGYNVTQFYHISIGRNSGDNRIMGGTQDNGTPYFTYNGATANQIDDVSSGDGSFSYFGQNFAYTSSQSGNVNRLRYDQQGNPAWSSGWSNITPNGAANQFFINPFVVDPSDENIMYYPAGNVLWRNNQLGSIDDFQNGTATGWTKLDNTAVPSGYGIYALNVSTTPSHILYYAAFNPQAAPKLYKLTNSNTSTSSGAEIVIPDAAIGAYINDIAINPDDANELIVVMSNYNITGLYHSVNGGGNFTAIEGNLEGTEQNPGPSLRAATILPAGGGKTYYLATSIGLFSAMQLNGSSTVWTQEGQNDLGNVIVSSVASRKSDGRVVAGTHGRGAFVGNESGGGAALLEVNASQLNIDVYPGLSRSTSFRISNPGGAQLSYSITASGGETNVKEKGFADLPKSSLMLTNKSALSSNYEKRLTIQKQKKGKDFYLKPGSSAAIEELILDDGNGFPAGFLGAGGTVYFYSANNFQVD